MMNEPCLLPDDAQKLCRFCLKEPDAGRQEWPAHPNIPTLFQQITGIKLEIHSDYSNLICTVCHDQMQLVTQIRDDFLRIETCWQAMLKRWQQQQQQQLKIEDVESFVESPMEADGAATNSSSSDDEQKHRKSPPKRENKIKFTWANMIYECAICGHGGMQTKRLLHTHMNTHRRHYADRGTCHICGKTNLKWLTSHLQDHRKKDRFRCEFCQKGFNRRTHLVNHQRVHTGERPFVCEICAYTFTSASTLTTHRKLHRIEEEAMATATPKPVRRRSLVPVIKYKTHANRQAKHPAAEMRPKLKCPLCWSTGGDGDEDAAALYNNRQTMYQHLKLMHSRPAGIDAWKQMLATFCMECHREFPDSVTLAAHKIEHLDFECSICRRRFNNRLAMEFHVQRHSAKERAHKCEVSFMRG